MNLTQQIMFHFLDFDFSSFFACFFRIISFQLVMRALVAYVFSYKIVKNCGCCRFQCILDVSSEVKVITDCCKGIVHGVDFAAAR